MKRCDLHTHSVFSDGTFSPEQIIDSSIETGLSAIALTDHKPYVKKQGNKVREELLEAIPALELKEGQK